jgi:tripartite-type tricarboxylate transporter receptor subunit TctC
VKLQAIPYKGGGPGMTDLIGGQVQLAFNNTLNFLPHMRSGKIRLLGAGRIAAFDAGSTIYDSRHR